MLYYENGDIKYYQEDGSLAKNKFITIGEKIYYVDSNGKALKWKQNIDGKEYYFTEKGYAYKGMLYYENGDIKYYQNDGIKKQDGWAMYKNNQVFIKNGLVLSNVRITIEESSYYFNYNGFIDSWVYTQESTYYYQNGVKQTGAIVVDRRNYYFNTSNGKLMRMTAPIPYYMQTDSRWANKKYGSGTMASTGCAQTCAAMAFSFLKNQTILPPDVASWGYKNGYYNGKVTGTIGSFWPAISKHYGIVCQGNLTVDQAIDALRHGKLVVAGMNPPNFTFEGTTHEIIIYGIDENNMVSVYDPYFKNHNKKYSINQIFKEKSTDKGDCTSGGPIFALG